MNGQAPNAVVYSCGCVTRVHSVASLRNDAAVVCCNHDDMIVVWSRSEWACIHIRVFYAYHNDDRVACDTLALCGIQVCVYDIRVFCCSLHDAMVAYNDRNDDDLASLRDVVAVVVVVDSVAYAPHNTVYDLDNVVCIHHVTMMDSEAPMEICRTYRAMVLALPKQWPQMTQKLSVI